MHACMSVTRDVLLKSQTAQALTHTLTLELEAATRFVTSKVSSYGTYTHTCNEHVSVLQYAYKSADKRRTNQHARTQAYVHAHKHAQTPTHTPARIYAYKHICTHTHIHAHTHLASCS
jgi:hypothetical protein